MTGWHFNVSHSHGFALLAIAQSGPVGVDVESVRPIDIDGMAAGVLSAWERALLFALPVSERPAAFFQAWTRKEAFVKACGAGIGYGLEHVEVTLGPTQAARLVRLDGNETAARAWTLCNLELAPGYVGALAVQGDGVRLVLRNWPEISPALRSGVPARRG